MPILPTWERIGYSTWRATWSGTAPYRLYQDGELLTASYFDSSESESETTTDGTTRDFETDAYEPPAIEILDDNDSGEAEQITYPPFAVLQWWGDSEAIYYYVYEYIDSAWSLLAVAPSRGEIYHQFRTQTLNDVTTTQFKIVPVDSEYLEGQPLPFDMAMVRNPATPEVSLTYDSNTLTVDAR